MRESTRRDRGQKNLSEVTFRTEFLFLFFIAQVSHITHITDPHFMIYPGSLLTARSS